MSKCHIYVGTVLARFQHVCDIYEKILKNQLESIQCLIHKGAITRMVSFYISALDVVTPKCYFSWAFSPGLLLD